MTILRTQRDGCWTLQTNQWGTFLAPTVDPDADTVITQEQLEGFELQPDTPRIPAPLWKRWVDLCIELCRRGTGDLEVSCRLVRNIEDPTQYRIYIPVQKVTGISVRVESFDKAVDIETGELVEQWPPEGWRPCGSSHSHNTMAAFFSGTDDKYELGDPGLHIVVGKIDVNTGQYDLCASITANRRRFLIDPADVVDYETTADTTYSHNCLDVITLPERRTFPTVPAKVTPYDSAATWNIPVVTPPVPSCVEAECNKVRAAVDSLIKEAAAQGIDVTNILQDLAMEIDEATTFYAPNTNDPFYWNDDYLL